MTALFSKWAENKNIHDNDLENAPLLSICPCGLSMVNVDPIIMMADFILHVK